MIPEREREALMRLTMCAREECIMCEYHKECDFDFQYELATESMNILAEALRKTEPITHDDYIESGNDYLEARCLNCNNAKACKEKHWSGCIYEPIEDEPQTCSVNGRPYDCGKCEYFRCTADEPQERSE